jgi:hypothetical protein
MECPDCFYPWDHPSLIARLNQDDLTPCENVCHRNEFPLLTTLTTYKEKPTITDTDIYS